MSLPGVAVVGLGAITAQGPDAAALWQGARAGRVAIRHVTGLEMGGYRTKFGGEVAGVPAASYPYRRPPDFRERVVELALAAAGEAVDGQRPLMSAVDGGRAGVVFGTCNAGLLSGRRWLAALAAGERPDPLLPALVPPQATAEAIAGAFGLEGPVLSVNTACAAGANAIGWAADLIRLGKADVMLAGGADALSDVLFAGFNALEALSPEPARPYSKGRQGLSLGEGAAFLLLAREDLAGPAPVAWIGGYGLSADGYHPTAPRPDGSGAARAIRDALRAAGVAADEVGYVNGHGTGTDKNDPAETRAIRGALGPAADRIAVSSTKSMIGHLLGAAGAAEALVTAQALAEQVAPPTASYLGPDPECDLDYVPETARPLDTRVALSNNFAFGGANACLVLTRDNDAHRTVVPDGRVVVTGLAVLSPAGIGVDAAAAAYLQGASMATAADRFGAQVGTLEFEPEPYLDRKARRRMDRLTVAGVVAAGMARDDAGLPVGPDGDAGTGVVFGTAAGPVEAMAEFTRPLFIEGAAAANPAVFPNTVYNQAAGQIAQHLRWYGPTSTVCAGHAAGASALAYGYDLLRAGHADAIVCVATDVLDELLVRAYRDLGLLSERPGDRRLPLGEASVAVVLERWDAARARGARIRAELAGYGMAARVSPRWLADPAGAATERAMRAALDAGGAEPDDVAGVWLAAAGLASVDRAETRALARLFPDRRPALAAPKRVLGDSLGAGGALCFALAASADASGPQLVNAVSLGGTSVALLLTPLSHRES